VSLALITSVLRTRKRKKKAIQEQGLKEHEQNTLSSHYLFGVDLGLGEALILSNCVLYWLHKLLYWMRCLKNLDALNSGGWGVFIAPTTKIAVGEGCCWWVHRTVRCASHVTQPLGFWQFRPLELWHLGAPDSPVLHRTCTVHCLVRLLALLWLCVNCPRTVHVAGDRWSQPLCFWAVAPLAHRTVRWIIAERLSRNPKVKSSACTVPRASNTVRWHSGQSSAPDHGSLRFLLLLSFEP
jgi:hypothetical protein